MSARPRWYHGMCNWAGPMGKAQVCSTLRRNNSGSMELPEPVLRLAQAEYDRQHPGQPYERMQERGGLSVLEVVSLLADALERERAGKEIMR